MEARVISRLLLFCTAIQSLTLAHLAYGAQNEWPLPSNRYLLNEFNKKSMKPLANKHRTAATLPNIVIFFVDDMGYGDVGFTGHPNINSPNIDKLASDGIILTTWYTGQPICSPSRAAMLTGRLPVRSGCAGGWLGSVFRNDAIGGLPSNESTFASVLKQAGYSTKMLGKWHLGQRSQFQPQNHGFDSAYWIPYSVDMGSSAWLPGDSDLPLPLLNNSQVLQQPVDLSKVSELYIAQATLFIEASVSSKAPFLLYMAHSHVHVPDFTNNKFCNSSVRGRFGDAVQEVDHVIGSVYAAIEKNGIAEDTLTFFTADNGPWLQKKLAGGSAGLFSYGKMTNWEGGMRQPAFAHWPGRIAAGSKSAEVVSTMDIFMTIVNITGSSQYLPHDDRIYDGKDMSDVIFNQNGGKSKHDCYPMYQGAVNASNCPYIHNTSDPKFALCSGLWAMRCNVPNYENAYKAHWVTRYTDGKVALEVPPLLFNIDWDPSELYPIHKENVNYEPIMQFLSQKRAEALQTVEQVPNQMLLGGNRDFEICAAPNSKEKYPTYPNCTETVDGFTGFTCKPVCYDEDNCAGGAPVAATLDSLPQYDSMRPKNDDENVYVTIHYN